MLPITIQPNQTQPIPTQPNLAPPQPNLAPPQNGHPINPDCIGFCLDWGISVGTCGGLNLSFLYETIRVQDRERKGSRSRTVFSHLCRSRLSRLPGSGLSGAHRMPRLCLAQGRRKHRGNGFLGFPTEHHQTCVAVCLCVLMCLVSWHLYVYECIGKCMVLKEFVWVCGGGQD